MLKITLFATLLLQNVLAETGRIKRIFNQSPHDFNESKLLEIFGEENGQEEFLLNETNALIQELVIEFDDLLQVETIGYTGEGRPLQVISFKGLDEDAPAVLFDGLHHAREIATGKMTFAILLKQLYGIYNNDEKALEMSSRVQMYILPVVNPDGLAYIESKEDIGNFGEDIVLKRKNTRHTSDSCSDQLQGVDLNRNYDVSVQQVYEWDQDQNPCYLTYRGPYPFSEPETRAMRDFILAHQDTLKFVINYHSYGNMLVIPYSGQDRSLVLTHDQRAIYDEIYRESNCAELNTIMGTGQEMVRYYSNGEASDWILNATGIIAISPELGSPDIQSMNFDIWSVELEARVVLQNLVMPFYLLEKAVQQVRVKPLNVQLTGFDLYFYVIVSNEGMTDVDEPFTMNFSTQVDITTYEAQAEIPALRSRETVQLRVDFESVSQLWHVIGIQRQTARVTSGRIGIFLDVTVDDDIHDKLGWTEENDRLYFSIDQHNAQFVSLAAQEGEIVGESTLFNASRCSPCLIVALITVFVLGYLACMRVRKASEVEDDGDARYVAV